MPFPLVPTLRAAGAWVAEELASSSALARIEAAVEGIPDGISGGYFECPLSHHGARVDILLAIRADDQGRRVIARDAALGGLGSRWGSGLVDFYQRWADPADRLHHQVPLTLLELDLDHGSGAGRPGFHFCIDPGFLEHGWAPPVAAPVLGRAELRELVEDVVGLVTGEPVDPHLLERLERCRASLPPGGRLLHLSIMQSRPGCPLKLNVVIPTRALPAWLRATGWPGDPRIPDEIMVRHGCGGRLAKLDVALGPELGERLGLELRFPGEPDTEPRWGALLERLVADGSCSVEQARALSTWPGLEEVAIEGLRWPALLERSLELKLVCGGRTLEAKAYLGFTPRFSLLGGGRGTLPPRPRSGAIREAGARSTTRRPILPLASLFEQRPLARPSALVSPQALHRLATAARWMPEACSSFCLECRLLVASDRVDVLGCIRVDDGGREALGDLDVPGWEPIVSFVERWRDPCSPLHESLPFIWLELDLPGDPTPEPPVPCLYVGIQASPASTAVPVLPARRWSLARFRHVLLELVEALAVNGAASAVEQAEHCFAALPNGAQLNCIGIMIPRRTGGLRLSLELPPSSLRTYLQTIGCPAVHDLLTPIERLLEHDPDRLALAIDVVPTVAPRLGVELFFHRPPALEPRFRGLLDALVDLGWCDRDKRLALEDWQGLTPLSDRSGFERTVYHVKVIVEPHVEPVVKSYPWLTGIFTEPPRDAKR